MKLLKEDTLFSRWVKERDQYLCAKCGKRYKPGDRGIQASHYWSRRHWIARFDPDNVDTLCYGCHSQVENDKQGWYTDYKREQLGTRKYNQLKKKVNQGTLKKHESIEQVRRFLQREGLLRPPKTGAKKPSGAKPVAKRPKRGRRQTKKQAK